MTLSGLARVKAGLKRFRDCFRPKALILLYHRVEDLATDPQLLAVPPQRFAEHIEYMAQRFAVVSLDELVEKRDQHPDRCVVVTFDDGYADNLYKAKPILEKYRVPATVFVASGNLGQDREFWWDELERILLHPSLLPPTLRLQITGAERKWELGGAARYSPEDCSAHSGWNVLSRETPTARHRAYRELCALLRPLSETERGKVLEPLRAWSGVETGVRETHRCLTPAEVASLASGSLVDVGAHTVSHTMLSTLSLPEQRTEILESRDRLEDLLHRPVKAFAYPYGTKSDYTRETPTLVREAGFSVACSNFPDVITTVEDVYQLPRFIVRDWGKETFARSIEDWFEGRRAMVC